MTQKVFGIGFQKTATTSLAVALYTLGYNVTGIFPIEGEIGAKVHGMAFDLADRYDAAQDTPWPLLYKELDKRYPGSKFILTIRQTDRWIKSVTRHFKRQRIPWHEWMYGVETAAGHEDVYIERYERHNREVMEYFTDRPEDLLVMDITQGDGWQKLCSFLQAEQPAFDFPTKNTFQERERPVDRVIRHIKKRFAPRLKASVNATFVRDVIHFHYTTFETFWASLVDLSEEQFTARIEGGERSIHDLILAQIEEEEYWLSRLTGSTQASESEKPMQTPDTIAGLGRRWQANMRLMRLYVANLNNERCNTRVGTEDAYLWEVLVHIMNEGVRRKAEIAWGLRLCGHRVETSSFMDFFRRLETGKQAGPSLE